MSFMQKQVYFGKFVEVESSDGSTFTPIEYFNADETITTLNDDQDRVVLTLHEAFFGRLSAPGYLDCTEWVGPFATKEEAMEALVDMYGDDENDDENDDDEELHECICGFSTTNENEWDDHACQFTSGKPV